MPPPTTVQFTIQTPRTLQPLTEQLAELSAVVVPPDLFETPPGPNMATGTSKLGIGTKTADVTTSAGGFLTRTVSYALTPLFAQVFPPGVDPAPTLLPIWKGLTQVEAKVRSVVTGVTLA